jgi:hypothetical protein
MSLPRSTRVLASFASLIAAGAVALPASAQVEVTSRPLAAPDLWSTPGRDTGLPTTLWEGTSADLARAVLPDLGQKPITPALRRLAIRVLATGANAPEGGGEDPALAAERAAALTRLGAPDAAYAALARTPRVEASEPLSRARAEAALYLGRTQEACDTERALQDGRGGGYWLKLRAFCLLQADETAAAQVTFDLWRQTGERAPAYTSGMAAALSGGAWKPVLGDGVTFALARRGGADLVPAIPTATPAALAVLALDPDGAAPVRAAAAARAADLGLITDAQARAAAAEPAARDAADLTSDEAVLPTFADELERAGADPKARTNVLLLAALEPPTEAAYRAAASGLDSPSPRIAASRALALDAAADAGRTGEAALQALAAAGKLGPDLSIADRALTVRALARAGLRADARALAIEGLASR